MSELARVRWRCRRGLMELEIILDRFLQAHYPTLSETEYAAFVELLTYQDADLWSLVAGEASEPEETKSRLIAMLRQC
jgi:antitoxin CptB